MQGLTVQEIYNQYLINKSRCGRKPIVLSKEKLDDINNKLENDWSLDAIAGRDKIDGKDEKISTKTLYKLAKQGVIDINKLRRKGKNNPKGHNEKRGKINTCKTIHERDMNCLKQNKSLPDSIEAMEIAINALEKRIAKKPKTDDRYVMYICPCCNDFIKVSHNCCQNCGQKLDWSDEE